MSSSKRDELIGFAVYGYIRRNFDQKCWVDEIMATIVEFSWCGVLFVCGDGEFGKLGIAKYKNDYCKTPRLCSPFIDDNAFKVSASTNHMLMLDTHGDVWCCGEGTRGQLGINRNIYDAYVPKKLNLCMRVIDVSTGRYHSLFLCLGGTVKGVGSNEYGQIGIGDLEKTFVPKTLEKLKKYKIIQINAGRAHSAALTEEGDLFCFGNNLLGQCGVGKEGGNYCKTPTKIDLDDEIEYVDCGSSHTLIITRKGLMYSCGWGGYGQLGYKCEGNKYMPTLVVSSKDNRMKMCAAGTYHSLCIDKEGRVWSFGSNKDGQCGISHNVHQQMAPQMIPWFAENGIRAKECAAGSGSSSVISFDGSLYVFGSNSHHQLGMVADISYYEPIRLTMPQNMSVRSVAMGYNHTAIICDAQK